MKSEPFAELMESAEEALDHAREKRELRTTRLPAPPEPMKSSDVKRLRARTRTSQAVFAHYLNVSTKLVQAWEARRREPEGAALRLLRLAERYPGVVFDQLRSDTRTKRNANEQMSAMRLASASPRKGRSAHVSARTKEKK